MPLVEQAETRICSAILMLKKIRLTDLFQLRILRKFIAALVMAVLEDNVVSIEKKIALSKCKCSKMLQKLSDKSTSSSLATVKACSKPLRKI